MKFGKILLATLFAVTLTVANIVAAKLSFFTIPYIGGVAVPAGFIAIGASFLWTDLMGELYGRETAKKVVNATIIALGFGWVMIYTSILLPTAPFYANEAAFNTTMGSSAIIVFSGIISMLFSQNIDVTVFHHLDTLTDGSHKWLRNIGSTGVSQFIDTSLFILLGFVALPVLVGQGGETLGVAFGMIIGQYVVKLVVALLDTPLFYILSGVLD